MQSAGREFALLRTGAVLAAGRLREALCGVVPRGARLIRAIDVKVHGTAVAVDGVINKTTAVGKGRQVLQKLVVTEPVTRHQDEGLQLTELLKLAAVGGGVAR